MNMHKKTTLDTGLRIVTEHIPNVRTAALGIWIDVGSRDETILNNGTSHFLEHMFFKGTKKRTAHQISMTFDRFGGMSNAFTSKDTTCLYATVPAGKLKDLAHLMADMFTCSRFVQQEIDRESQVILQEIAMVADMPDDQAYEQFEHDFWGDHALGQTVLGQADVVASMTTEKLLQHIKSLYHPRNVVVSCAGKVNHEEFCSMMEPLFADFKSGDLSCTRTTPVQERVLQKRVVSKQFEQVHLLLGVKGLHLASEQRFVLVLLNTLLGGNMSSRLFQEIREKRGLAYSISSFVESYADCGYLGISGGVAPETVNETLAVIHGQLQSLMQPENIGVEEFQYTLDHAQASLFLSGENLESRMIRNARNEFYFNRDISLDEVSARIAKVTRLQVAELAHELFSESLSGLVMGDVQEKDIVWPM
jgi:predicted Zn-dependent peptidase